MKGDGERFRLPRATRITASEEIRTLFRRGKRKKTRHLDVFITSSPVGYSRLGVVVPRYRQKVVKRNLLKRRLREIGRTVLLPGFRSAGLTLDILIRARPEAYRASHHDLLSELTTLREELCSREA